MNLPFGMNSFLIKSRVNNCFSAFRIPAARALSAINRGDFKIPMDGVCDNRFWVYEICGDEIICRAAQSTAALAKQYLTSDNMFVFYYDLPSIQRPL